jgi:NAD(P)-dependent dehydrogenase (short-subunit alcohol dehydrogenase family)
MTDQLQDMTALITGAASGIGRAGVERFAAAGARVVAVDVDEEGLGKLAAEIGNDAVKAVAADVTDEESLASAFKAGAETFGPLDCVWNNAGLEVIGPLALCSTDEYRRIFDVNVLGVLLGTKLAAGQVKDGGSIINTASIAGLSGIPMQALYAASKAAVVSVTRTAALELASRQIRANCLCPGIVDTPMIGKSLGGEASPELKEMMASTNPFGRLVESSEVARIAVFLASGSGTMINGQAIAIDGGMTAGPQLDVANLLS